MVARVDEHGERVARLRHRELAQGGDGRILLHVARLLLPGFRVERQEQRLLAAAVGRDQHALAIGRERRAVDRHLGAIGRPQRLGRAAREIDRHQVVLGARWNALVQAALAVAADVGERPRLVVVIDLLLLARRRRRRHVHAGADIRDRPRAVEDRVGLAIRDQRGVALLLRPRRELDHPLAVEVDPEVRPLLVGAMVRQEHQRLAIGRRHRAGHPLLQRHQPRRRRVRRRRVRDVQLRQPIAIRREHDPLAVARELRPAIDERLDRRRRGLGELRVARCVRPRRLVRLGRDRLLRRWRRLGRRLRRRLRRRWCFGGRRR